MWSVSSRLSCASSPPSKRHIQGYLAYKMTLMCCLPPADNTTLPATLAPISIWNHFNLMNGRLNRIVLAKSSTVIPSLAWTRLHIMIFIALVMSDRKLEASREGSKRRIYGI